MVEKVVKKAKQVLYIYIYRRGVVKQVVKSESTFELFPFRHDLSDNKIGSRDNKSRDFYTRDYMTSFLCVFSCSLTRREQDK